MAAQAVVAVASIFVGDTSIEIMRNNPSVNWSVPPTLLPADYDFITHKSRSIAAAGTLTLQDRFVSLAP